MCHEPTVFLVDDDAGVRSALTFSLQEAGWDVEPYTSGQEFLNAYVPSRPGCLLMDLCMPELDGLAVQQELIKREIQLPIIFMTGYGTVRESVAAIRAGALDFLEKPFPRAVLLERIGEAIGLDKQRRGNCSAQTQAQAHQAEAKSHYESLSPRETEVMALISAGNSSKQIAKLLGISPRTVDAHRARLMVKMQVSSLAELGALFTLCANSLETVIPSPGRDDQVSRSLLTKRPERKERVTSTFLLPKEHRYPDRRSLSMHPALLSKSAQ